MSQSRTTEILESSLGKPTVKRGTDTTITPDTGYVICAIQAETPITITTAVGNFAANAFDSSVIATEGVRYGRFTSVTFTGTGVFYQVSK